MTHEQGDKYLLTWQLFPKRDNSRFQTFSLDQNSNKISSTYSFKPSTFS